MYGYGYYGYYSLYWILIPAIILSAYASFKVRSTFSRYTQVASRRGMTGMEVARRILDSKGLYDVRVEPVRGSLTDHYDPRTRTVRLSEPVYGRTSISAISVAAHECGHAVQHQESYFPLTFRNTIVPVVNFASSASWIILILGFVMSATGLIYAGIYLFAATVIFQLVTLPVEFNASSRALKIIGEMGIVDSAELKGSKKVLSAAALTYVAAALTSVLQLLRLVLIANSRN